MCGIAGVAGREDPALVQRMTEAIAHRGPDAEGLARLRNATLGHRRLSIIDLAGGAQPMPDASGRYCLTYNGEIYNYQDLKKDLEAAGYAFESQSDTEVLLAAFCHWGPACVHRFQGMFAFAIWDQEEERLFLARDPIGVKPLYYALHEGACYFASEMKALLLIPGLSHDLDLEGLDDYLTFLYTTPPRTCYQAIRQLPPGHSATWAAGRWSEDRYWRLEAGEAERSPEAWAEAVNAKLAETIDKYLVSDVPLGAFLSGGLDSATIVAHMKAAHPGRVDTFTIGFEEEGSLYDESNEAAQLAAFFGVRHHPLCAKADVTEVLPRLLHHFDEPFGNPTALLSYAICGLVREHVTVVLSGDGGDEVFGGYPRYAGVALARAWRRLPQPLRRHLINPLIQRLPESTRGFHTLRRLREFSAASLLNPVDMYAAWIQHCSLEERRALYTPEITRALGGRNALDPIHALAAECPDPDPIAQAMYIDLHAFLPNNVLHYGDRMSMAHGLETRVPLADPDLVRLLFQMPSELKVSPRQSKIMLRRCMADRLPPEVSRRKKIGFNPPMGVWLNTRLKPLVDDYLSPQRLRQSGYFNPKAVQRLLEEHRQSRRDHTWRIWALLLFELWRRQTTAQ